MISLVAAMAYSELSKIFSTPPSGAALISKSNGALDEI
jgi:hypothetical protein